MEFLADERSLTVKTTGPLETESVGIILGALLGPGDVVGLSGDLGAGKTCFTRGIAVGLGVDRAVPVVSPSFTILNEYVGHVVLYHFDFYRLEGISADFDLEWREYFYGRGVVVVEWAQKVADNLPDDRIDVTFSFLEDEEREIRIASNSERCAELIKECAETLVNGKYQ